MRKEILQIYENHEFGRLTVLEKDGEFFFFGKEVATLLGYSNASKAVIMHVDIEDKTQEMIAHSQNGKVVKTQTTLINESGLYALILSSKLPSAKRFKQWITKEVLPSIRKHGGYLLGQKEKTPEEILADAVMLANNLIAEKENEIKTLKPKARYYDQFVEHNLLTNFRNTAKELGIPQKQFIDYLLEEGFLYRDRKRKLLPYAKKNKGYFEVKEWYNDQNDLVGIQTLITPKGRRYLLFLLGGEDKSD